MSKTEEDFKTCESCGAMIYPEHIKKHAAEYWGGKLLCPHCLHEKKLISFVNPAAAYADDNARDDKPIALVMDDRTDDKPAQESPSTSIRAFGGGPDGRGAPGAAAAETQYRRPLLENSPNATRCRMFHCKLNNSSFAHLTETMNEWVDSHDGIEIKFATSSVGPIEGKSSSDQHLIVTVFY